MNNKDPKLFPGKDLDTIQTNKQISNQKFYLLTYNLFLYGIHMISLILVLNMLQQTGLN